MAGGGDRYEEVSPPVDLRPWVRCVWTYAEPNPSGTLQRIAPDGCPELVIDLGAPYEEQDADGAFRLQPDRILAGQMARPMAIRPVGPVELVAVRFQPDGARDWWGRSMAETTDRRIDVRDRLADLEVPAGDPRAQVRAVIAWLRRQRDGGGWIQDRIVRAQVEALTSEGGPIRWGPGERRTIQRRFLDRVGVPMRTLRSIHRFRRVFDGLSERVASDVRWLEAGLEAGYFDQPQMARDFRRFLGCTATQWACEQVELARRIASQTYKPDGPPAA